MSFEEVIHEVNDFPAPFKENCTPYDICDFGTNTKYHCRNFQDICNNQCYKIIVLGDVSVGKTCVINRFCHQEFSSLYKATIGVDFEIELFKILGISITMQIWDTAGQERFKCIAQSYYRKAHAIILVFDLSHLDSLVHCKEWLKEALNAGNTSEASVFLVGNKRDLMSSASYESMEEISILTAKSLNAEYWPVSAKTGENIKLLFFRIAAITFDAMLNREDALSANEKFPIGTNLLLRKTKTQIKRKTSAISAFFDNLKRAPSTLSPMFN